MESREINEAERKRGCHRDRRAEPPADPRRIAYEKVRKPRRDRRGAQVHEDAQRDEIARQRQMQRSVAEKLLQKNDQQGKNQVGREKGDRPLSVV